MNLNHPNKLFLKGLNDMVIIISFILIFIIIANDDDENAFQNSKLIKLEGE